MLARDTSIEAATDDWPFLYMQDRHIPQHYVVALLLILAVSVASVLWVLRGQSGGWSWQFFFLGAGFMLLETKAIIQFALLWGSTWIVASLAIASVLTHGAAGHVHRVAGGDPPAGPGRGCAGGPAAAQCRRAGRPRGHREPRRSSHFSTRC